MLKRKEGNAEYPLKEKGENLMYPCFVVTESNPVCESQTRTFGIAMMKDGYLLDELLNLTIRRVEAEKMVRKLNQGRVAAIHFRDVIADWITEQAML